MIRRRFSLRSFKEENNFAITLIRSMLRGTAEIHGIGKKRFITLKHLNAWWKGKKPLRSIKIALPRICNARGQLIKKFVISHSVGCFSDVFKYFVVSATWRTNKGQQNKVYFLIRGSSNGCNVLLDWIAPHSASHSKWGGHLSKRELMRLSPDFILSLFIYEKTRFKSFTLDDFL